MSSPCLSYLRDYSVSRPVSSFSTSRLNSSFGGDRGLVQPGCTIELLTLCPRQLGSLQPLRPSHFFTFPSRLRRQVLMDGHQVVRLPS
jgi:hypothetical protein